MKTYPHLPVALLALLLGVAAAAPVAAAPAGKTQQLTSPDQVPEGLAKSDWHSIRAAYEAGRHAFQPVEGGWQARNPGQQWTTTFDRRGFVAEPKGGGWQWGLELKGYGFPGAVRDIQGVPAVQADGQRLTYGWDATVQEWWVNDTRGLEHGFTVKERPPRSADFQSAVSPISNRQGNDLSDAQQIPGASQAGSTAIRQIGNLRYDLASAEAPLTFTLAVRGSLTARVAADGLGVEFRDGAGATVLHYAGLKVWDADGKVLPSHFEAVDGRARHSVRADSSGWGEAADEPAREDARPTGRRAEDCTPCLRLLVDERGARYPLTIDPIAQQAYLKPAAVGTTQADDRFGFSVAVSGDTVVVGANNEDSSTTGVNSSPNESADGAGAAYVFALLLEIIHSKVRGPNQFWIEFTGAVSTPYRVESSQDLQIWTDRGLATPTTPGHYEFTDNAAPLTHRFYRAVRP